MQEHVSLLLPALMQASCFEQAACAVLQSLLHLADQALLRSAYASEGALLRAMVHLRPEDGYRRLVLLEEGQKEVSPFAEVSSHLPSTTAWRCVVERGAAVAIDVQLARLLPLLPEAASLSDRVPGEGVDDEGFGEGESRVRFLSRRASHVLALPLRSPGGVIEGMISIEASCPGAVGQPFLWPACHRDLQLLSDIAAPYLTSLPLRPASTAQADALMPVVGASMTNLMSLLRVFVRQDETLLILGPTGSGKSRLARWCHERSPRSGRPFECLDLHAVPEELQVGELFGWRRGAFTGAVRDNPGAVSRAGAGTLFIDEIDKLSLRAQAALLTLLETRRYHVLGDVGGERRADVRFIIGTNSNLQAAVRAGRFREDLYYRINVLPVSLPPLRERRDEIVPWATFMATRRHHGAGGAGPVRIHPDAERLLLEQSWPGNLRQLDNIIRRAYALCLMELGDGAGDVTLREHHLQRALSYDDGADAASTLELLRLAAAEFVGEAQRRAEGLDLELCDAFHGVVLATAVSRLGREEAFRILGKELVIKNRNQGKTLRRALERVEALCRALHTPFPFADLVAVETRDG